MAMAPLSSVPSAPLLGGLAAEIRRALARPVQPLPLLLQAPSGRSAPSSPPNRALVRRLWPCTSSAGTIATASAVARPVSAGAVARVAADGKKQLRQLKALGDESHSSPLARAKSPETQREVANCGGDGKAAASCALPVRTEPPAAPAAVTASAAAVSGSGLDAVARPPAVTGSAAAPAAPLTAAVTAAIARAGVLSNAGESVGRRSGGLLAGTLPEASTLVFPDGLLSEASAPAAPTSAVAAAEARSPPEREQAGSPDRAEERELRAPAATGAAATPAMPVLDLANGSDGARSPRGVPHSEEAAAAEEAKFSPPGSRRRAASKGSNLSDSSVEQGTLMYTLTDGFFSFSSAINASDVPELMRQESRNDVDDALCGASASGAPSLLKELDIMAAVDDTSPPATLVPTSLPTQPAERDASATGEKTALVAAPAEAKSGSSPFVCCVDLGALLQGDPASPQGRGIGGARGSASGQSESGGGGGDAGGAPSSARGVSAGGASASASGASASADSAGFAVGLVGGFAGAPGVTHRTQDFLLSALLPESPSALCDPMPFGLAAASAGAPAAAPTCAVVT
eukprot:TRINITY_DN13996_c0_g3_i1.p1 TRINITY_DN13996_c0_g3~~TRINITY_DN13996_c0_g3_i1.p1  ORF type:complete len:574 (+),score=137.88 TRINITY_DN13996_c0_g3_i1:368-2089(+)